MCADCDLVGCVCGWHHHGIRWHSLAVLLTSRPPVRAVLHVHRRLALPRFPCVEVRARSPVCVYVCVIMLFGTIWKAPLFYVPFHLVSSSPAIDCIIRLTLCHVSFPAVISSSPSVSCAVFPRYGSSLDFTCTRDAVYMEYVRAMFDGRLAALAASERAAVEAARLRAIENGKDEEAKKRLRVCYQSPLFLLYVLLVCPMDFSVCVSACLPFCAPFLCCS